MSGMAIDEDGDTFFDDDFPDIAEDELQQLEQNATSHTQRGTRFAKSSDAPHAPHRQHLGSVQQHAPSSHVHRSNTTASTSAVPGLGQKKIHTAAIDGLDENGVPLVVEESLPSVIQRQPDETTLREQWRKERFGQTGHQSQARPQQSFTKQITQQHQPSSRFQAYPSVVHQQTPSQYDSFSPLHSAILDDDSLQTKIEELNAQLASANEELLARKGEIQIIRAKNAEGDRIHHRELDAIRRLKQEEAEKHRLAIEALQGEKAKIVSDAQFMKQELSDESRRVQSLQRQLKERPLREKPNNVETTPKKHANSLRDGFDDEDLMIISPVKSGRRSNKGTPTANRKRKQPPLGELDVQPLVLRPSLGNTDDVQPTESATSNQGQKITPHSKEKEMERHLRLVQRVLSFCPVGSRESVTEQLMKLNFPSDGTCSMGSIVLRATAMLGGARLPGDLLQIFIDLWSKALKEKFYACIHLLIDITNFVLDLDCFVVDTDIVSNILPLIQLTAEINAKARFRLLVKQDWLDNPEKKKPIFDNAVSTTICLDLLYTIASLASDEADLISQFWRSMSTDFVLMMLNACQPVKDVSLMLQLLATSILPTTFGNVCTTEEQTRMETYITDRVCYLLWEIPKTLEGEAPYSKKTICKLRLEAIDLLTKFSIMASLNPYDPTIASNHGTIFLANHPTAIARLVRSIYEETAAMYLVTPTQSLHADLVNSAVRVLHFVLNSPAGREIDLQRKLAGTNGGAHKHRVVLTRLAFSEGQFIDRGITEDTVRMATDLLEDSVTPDEADDLTAAFGGSTGRSGSTQR